MKDYYRILGVPPHAETNEIRAAYKKLIKRYHPDTLDSSNRDDPDILQTVQELNEAYAILGNEEKRLLYDDAIQVYKDNSRPLFTANQDYEQRLYLIRCGRSKRTYRMFLARRHGSSAPWLILGFEPLEDVPQIALSGMKRQRIWDRLFSWLSGDHATVDVGLLRQNAEPADLTNDSIQQQPDESDVLTLGDIDWNIHACPDCGSMIKNANGTLATWSGCSTCGHIKCVGGAKRYRRGLYSTCPWCGKKNRVTRSVPLGTKDSLSLRGDMGRVLPVASSNDKSSLEDGKGNKLGTGKG